MFLTLKKYDIISCLMALMLAFLTFSYIKTSCETVITNALPYSQKVIVVDAGHGYPDGGAVASDGTEEKNLNLDVALKLQNHLEKSGAYVLLTRADDNAVSDNLEKKLRDLKREDLKNRWLLKENEKCDAFISVHLNKFPIEKYSGAQVFYAKGHNESKILGECIQNRLKAILNPQNERVAKESDGSIFVLKNSTVPSVIVECGFLSNEEELKLLKSEEYREKIAFAIYLGISDFLSK